MRALYNNFSAENKPAIQHGVAIQKWYLVILFYFCFDLFCMLMIVFSLRPLNKV